MLTPVRKRQLLMESGAVSIAEVPPGRSHRVVLAELGRPV